MSRYENAFPTGMSSQQASDVATEYLQSEGFKHVDERGEMVWRKGFGALANPQFIKLDVAQDGSAHVEAWTAGISIVPGVYGGELNPMEGVWGAGPKMALRPRVAELERRLGGVSTASDSPAPVPAGWFPDPTKRHEHRYWDGTRWTATVSDAEESSTDPAGAS